MKRNIVWTKTLLTVYRYFERVAGAIDKIILKSGLNSSNICGYNYFQNNVMSITQKLIDLSERKVTLINLKVLVEDILSEIDEKDALILLDKYVTGLKTRELTEKYNMSMRGAFRKIEHAETAFSSRLSVKGFSDAKLSKMIEKEEWIKHCFNRLSAANEEVILSKVELAKAVSL